MKKQSIQKQIAKEMGFSDSTIKRYGKDISIFMFIFSIGLITETRRMSKDFVTSSRVKGGKCIRGNKTFTDKELTDKAFKIK